MRRTIRALVLVGAALVLSAAASAAAPPKDDAQQAKYWAQRLQDDARVLRNGTRTGASVDALMRERERMAADLESLMAAYTRWASALAAEPRARADASLTEMHEGCERMRLNLAQLADVLRSGEIQRARVQALGRNIARQAHDCERLMGRAERQARAARRA